jgi:hypothetical protein
MLQIARTSLDQVGRGLRPALSIVYSLIPGRVQDLALLQAFSQPYTHFADFAATPATPAAA